jgi:hypothetical protein
MYEYKTVIKCVQAYTAIIKCSHESFLKYNFNDVQETLILYENLMMNG